MPTFNNINIKQLNQIEEVAESNYLIVETQAGTNIIDFKDFVVGPNNVSFYSSFTSLSSQVNTLSAVVDSVQPGQTAILKYDASGASGAGISLPSGVNNIKVTCIGGGGGGGGSSGTGGGSGGGAGGVSVKYYKNVKGKTYSYQVGAGGGQGTAGQDTTFTLDGFQVVAKGGGAGVVGNSASTYVAAGAGGIAGAGDIALVGSAGENGAGGATAAGSAGGQGGHGFMGCGAGRGGVGSNGSGTVGAANTGAGGGGGSSGGTGASGGTGLIIIEY